MNRGQIKTRISKNLADAGVFFSDNALNDSLQDAYNEVASRARCIIKSATLAQLANRPYYDFISLGVTDYLATIGVFNNETQFWLRDDISLRDFDRLRRNWELWTGSPQFWAPHSLRYIAVAPNNAVVTTQTFTLWYWATAPTFTLDTNTPLIATDKQNLLENYACMDLLGDAKEYTKASIYLAQYEEDLEEYKKRCVNLAAADLLQRV
ncbi:MAG TPA: hypothetical protein VNX68_17350 [Nitrosopumilaceae archaeon]|jgi:hypothetical protein|nr:hypothetical protein [Nitrosopumilaceae archaeon]